MQIFKVFGLSGKLCMRMDHYGKHIVDARRGGGSVMVGGAVDGRWGGGAVGGAVGATNCESSGP